MRSLLRKAISFIIKRYYADLIKEHTVYNQVDVLSFEQYAKLEQRMGNTAASATMTGEQYAYHLGQQSVLKEVRTGFALPRRDR